MRHSHARLFALGAVLGAAWPGAAQAQDVPAEPAPRSVMSLAQVEKRALAKQPQVLSARSATRAAEAQRDLAMSPLLPQLLLTGSYSRQTGNFVPRPGSTPPASGALPAPTFQSYNFWAFGFTATQQLYDFGQTIGRYQAARATLDAQRSSEEVAQHTVVLGVRRAYFSARAARELGEVAAEALAAQEKHLVQVEAFVKVGTQPEIALAQQRAALANARVQLIAAQNGYETAKAQLNLAAGIGGGTDYDVDDQEFAAVDGEDAPLEALVHKAIDARPELAVIAKRRSAQQHLVSAQKGGYGPSIAAIGGASAQGTDFTALVPNWNVGITLTWPVYQGGATRAAVAQAEAGLDTLDAERSQQELEVRLEIDSARLGVRAAKASIGAAEDAVTSAHEQLHLAEQRYATGAGSILELTDAQLGYTNAAAQLVAARYALASARAQLLSALGRR